MLFYRKNLRFSSLKILGYQVWYLVLMFIPFYVVREMLVPDSIARQSTCLLEVDAIALDILNKKEIKGNC